MSDKTKTIKLSDGHAPKDGLARYATDEAAWRKAQRFRVEQIGDSIDYFTGQLLERKEVEDLCAAKDWKVTIVPIKN